MNGHGGVHFGEAAVGKPGMLLLKKKLEATRELSIIQVPRPVTPQLAIEPLGESRQDEFHQLSVHAALGMRCSLKEARVRLFALTLFYSTPGRAGNAKSV